jgi:hypothetical protein
MKRGGAGNWKKITETTLTPTKEAEVAKACGLFLVGKSGERGRGGLRLYQLQSSVGIFFLSFLMDRRGRDKIALKRNIYSSILLKV